MEKLLTAQEAADILKVHLRTVYIYLRSGELRAAKIGDSWRIRQEDLDEFIRRRTLRRNNR